MNIVNQQNQMTIEKFKAMTNREKENFIASQPMKNIKKNTYKKYFGVGICDVDVRTFIEIEGKQFYLPSFTTWQNMLQRVYYRNSKYPRKSYENVTVCSEWLQYSKFREWWLEHYIEGAQMDKDWCNLYSNHKCYSPETCIFMTQEENILFRDLIKLSKRINGIH